MPTTIENREIRETVEGIELRAAPGDTKSPGTIIGYAARYEKYSVDLGYFREKIASGAFDMALMGCDVRCLFNHDPNRLLGRTSARTLRLLPDEIGLRMECDLPDTDTGQEVAELVRRGDLQGQSFSFTTSIDQWDWSGDTPLRTLIQVDELFDVGPVTFPAYEETTVAMRAFRSQQEQRSKPPDPPAPPSHVIEHQRDTARLRLLEVS